MWGRGTFSSHTRCCLGCSSLEQPLPPSPTSHETRGLPEVVAWGHAALLRNTVESGEGIFGDALVPGLVQVAHPADLNAQNAALEKGGGCERPHRAPGPALAREGAGRDKQTTAFFAFSRWRTKVGRKKVICGRMMLSKEVR